MAGQSDIFEIVTADGAVLRAISDGHGPALLLVSGLGGTAAFWSPVVARLAERFTVLRFDQRGIAGSTRGAAPCSIATLATDALAVLDAAGFGQAVALGHSTGGCIVQAMAQAAPQRIAHAVLSATWIVAGPYMRALFGMRKRLLDTDPEAYAQSAALLSYPPAWLERHWHVFEKASSAVARTPADKRIISERIEALLAHDGRTMLSCLTMPVSILGAADDLIVPAFHQHELSRALPEARLTIQDTGGHFYPVTAPDAFVDILLRETEGRA